MKSAAQIFAKAAEIISVPPEMTCAEWADAHFYLSSESSNTSGKWVTTPIQRAILNAFGNDAIEKVDFFKPTRFGGTKMDIAALFYFIAHKRRNTCFYQPTSGDSDEFVKSEIQPAIRDCKIVDEKLISKAAKSSENTLGFKAFRGCNAYFKGGSSPSSYERMTLDAVILDELDLFEASIGKNGDPTTLSWARVRNANFKKQIQTSKPTIKGFSLIEKSSRAAEDMLTYRVPCPECGEHHKIEWGGKDVPYGFKWENNDPSTVMHYCPGCGAGWRNNKLMQALHGGYWLGDKGWKTADGITWEHNDEPSKAPRHIAFASWSGYSTMVSWRQIVEEWLDAKGDIQKIQTFTNNVLAQSWDITYAGSVTAAMVGSIIPTDDLDGIIAITAGIDVQPDRLEVQYVGHDRHDNVYVMDYDVYWGDADGLDVYTTMARDVALAKFTCGGKELGVINACIDTQGSSTNTVHKFLNGVRRQTNELFIGINGVGTAVYAMANKHSVNKNVTGSKFYSIGTDVLKTRVYSAIRNHDKEKHSFRIATSARLPNDYAKQLTCEKMTVKRRDGKDRIAFDKPNGARNEALDTMVYAIAAKEYVKMHRGRAGRKLFEAVNDGSNG